jgi:hypothetical protein
MQHTMRQNRQWILILGLWSFFTTLNLIQQAFANEAVNRIPTNLPPPSGEVLLIVNGSINRTNVSGEAHLDNAIIQRLPQHRLQTTTSVTDGIRQFDGFLLRDLLNLVLAEGDMVTAKALNNYRIDIPISDFYDYDVLVATHMDGERLLPSGKGPFWIIYPRDAWPQLQDIRYDYRWVWQLHRLTVK